MIKQTLYNFDNLTVGDSITDQYQNFVVVAIIDSIQINNTYRKRYSFSEESTDIQYLIEGIGFTSGLFPNFSKFEKTNDLICFRHNNQILWENTYTQPQYSCETPLNINNEKTTQNKIYPNPIEDYLFIENLGTQNNEKIEIYNTLGEIVLTEYLFKEKHKIDLSNLNSGVYFLKFTKSKQTSIIIKH